MTTTTTGAGGETPNAALTGETPEPSASGETPGAKYTTVEDAQKEIERLTRSLQRANSEAKTHREKATELDKLKQQIENDKLSETERLQKQVADLQKAHDQALAEAQSLKLNTQVATTAAKLGFADPDDAIKFLGNIDDGSNVESLLKDLLKSKPYLAGQQRVSSGGATNPSRSQANANQGITEEYIDAVLQGKPGVTPYEKLTKAQQEQFTDMLTKRKPYH